MMIMEKKVHSETSPDRLSALPEPIKEHVLSFLMTKHAVRTSILSSAWRTVWVGLPCLDFGRCYLCDSLTTEKWLVCDKDDASRVKRELLRKNYYDFLDRTFGSIVKVEKLKLFVPGFGLKLKDRVDHWVDCIVRCHVEELELEIGGLEAPRYCLPKSVLSICSLTKLNLERCELKSSLMDAELPSLRILFLQNVYLDEEVMGCLLVNLPNLEDITFWCCEGLTRLEVYGHTKLKRVYVKLENQELEVIEIGAVNLSDFTYWYEGYYKDESCEIKMAGCVNMKSFELDGAHLDDYELSLFLEEFPILEQLVLTNCQNLEYVEISSQHMNYLSFRNCRELIKFKLDTPNLKMFCFDGEEPISLVSRGSAMKLRDATIRLKPGFETDKWYVSLVKFLAKLSHSETLSLDVVTESVRLKCRPPLSRIKHLEVEVYGSALEYTPVQFIESLLWLAPCPESIRIFTCGDGFLVHENRKLFKFIYEKPLKGNKKCGCWKSLPINCWRHSLTEVSLENQEDNEADTELANFFSKGRTDGKMVCFVKKMNMEKKVHAETSSDRLSALPEPMKQHILSFLTTKTAVRTSILSSSWRTLWVGLPSFDFGEMRLGCSLTMDISPVRNKGDAIWVKKVSKREKFYDFLDRTFGSFIKVEKVTLYVPGFGPKLASRVDHWVDCIVRCHVEELELHIGGENAPRYCLSKSVLSITSLRKLRLENCELQSSFKGGAKLPCLQELYLKCVFLDQEVMGCLLVNCPNIENFTFSRCQGLTRLELLGLTKLVKISVWLDSQEVEVIEIGAPNLSDFHYFYDGCYGDESCEIKMAGCKNMKRFELDYVQLDDYELSLFLEEFPILEQLVLIDCHSLECVKISNHHLVLLQLGVCRKLTKLELNTPNLKEFHFFGIEPISLVSRGLAMKLTDASIFLEPRLETDEWYVGLVRLLAKLSQSETLSLDVAGEEALTIPEMVRLKYRPPLSGVKHLKIKVRVSSLHHTPVEFIESLLWLAPCPESITIDNYNGFLSHRIHKLFKFMYEKPLKGKKKCGCWKSLPINCWRHSLTKVSLENQKGDEDDTKLANFFRGARVDGKLVCFVKNVVTRKHEFRHAIPMHAFSPSSQYLLY